MAIEGTGGDCGPAAGPVAIAVADPSDVDADFAGRDVSRLGEAGSTPGVVDLAVDHSPTSGYRLSARGNGVFAVTKDRIRCVPDADAPEARWQRFVAGQVLPTAAVLNGFEVLHASAVAIRGACVLLVAGSGTGKTTLALELVARGATFIADDVAALELRDGDLLVHPGPAAVNTPPAAVPRSGGGRVGSDGAKPRVALGRATRAHPLRLIYFVRRGLAIDVLGVTAAPTIDLLLGSTFNLFVQSRARLGHHLEVAAVAERVSSRFRLEVPDDCPPGRTADRLHDHAHSALRRQVAS